MLGGVLLPFVQRIGIGEADAACGLMTDFAC